MIRVENRIEVLFIQFLIESSNQWLPSARNASQSRWFNKFCSGFVDDQTWRRRWAESFHRMNLPNWRAEKGSCSSLWKKTCRVKRRDFCHQRRLSGRFVLHFKKKRSHASTNVRKQTERSRILVNAFGSDSSYSLFLRSREWERDNLMTCVEK